MDSELIIALREEIGNSDLFVGRKKELDFFLDWADKTKRQLSQSTAILSRKKKGKTALVQRLYNILYTKNDPQIIPFYFKVEEGKKTQLHFSDIFFRTLLTQYFGYKQREKEYIGQVLPYDELKKLAGDDQYLNNEIDFMIKILEREDGDEAWMHARNAGHRISSNKDERIIQIIDEFQFLNEFIYVSNDFQTKIELAAFYQSTAESKVSPQIITGSYIGWLSAIIGRMVARYRSYNLTGFNDREALGAVYNYSNIYELEVTEESAAYIAKVCENDPYYIAQIFRSQYPDKDLTEVTSIVEILNYETTITDGAIGRMWSEYIWNAVNRVNDKNGKKIILYLSKYADEERTREEILKDLNLDLTDRELEKRLHQLVKADIISQGSSNYRFKGLGDRIFEIVFRKIYQEEIERIGKQELDRQIKEELLSVKKQVSYYKGMAAEYRVINKLLFAAIKSVNLQDIVSNYQKPFELERFDHVQKKRIHLDQVKSIELDILCQSDNFNLVIEVKDWEKTISTKEIEKFIETKRLLDGHFNKQTGYIFYSENGFSDEQKKLLEQNGIMYTSGELLK